MPSGSFVQHTPQLYFARNGLTVHLEDHVMDAKTGLAGGRIAVDVGDFGSGGLLQLEGAGAVIVDIANVYAQVTL